MSNRQVVPFIQTRPAASPRQDVSITNPQELARRLHVLENSLVRVDTGRRRWKVAAAVALVTALIAAGAAWAAISSVTIDYQAGYGEVNNWDTSKFTVTTGGQLVNALTTAAAGTTSGAAIEMALVLGAANTALAIGDWVYIATVKEFGVATVTSGTYKVELFQDGTSLGALYMKQATSDALNLEGVTFKWTLGSALPTNAAYTLKVTNA